MEMNPIEVEYIDEFMEDTSVEQLLSQASLCVSGIDGDPQALPRVGDQYQAEIPPLTAQVDGPLLSQNPTGTKGAVDVDYIRDGLPVPVMWVHDVVDLLKYKLLEFHGNPIDTDTSGYAASKTTNAGWMNSKSIVANQYESGSPNHHANISESSLSKFECWDDEVAEGKGLGRPLCHDCTVIGHMDGDCPSEPHKNSNLEKVHVSKDYHPVPGSLDDSWSDIERENFLLGLYIFGKNLAQVKRFIESKGMGDVQSFYYGQFYRSSGHRRWSECRKMRSRRCVHGQRIFMGWRQQELLSRLLPRVPDECGKTLVEVTKIFGEGRISLEEYVSSLKGLVGLKILVEAIGIGKGRKRDLTGVVIEPVKTNHVISLRSEIPIGKACSTLTSGDIIKFLTGDFRLSKAKSNDLFWEAVWPRLLARGWHSEQPKNYGCVGTKHSLVFLMPGIRKFSRRKLVKGDHYFDSISDVLNKVALDPKLLELEAETVNNESEVKKEYPWDPPAKLDQVSSSDRQRHCYLRPRIQNSNPDLTKFTIVDTSLLHGEEPRQVRELRSLPVGITPVVSMPVGRARASVPTSFSSESDSESSSEDQADKPDSADMLLNNQESHLPASDASKPGNSLNCMPNKGLYGDISDQITAHQKQGMQINEPDLADTPSNNREDPFPSLWNGEHYRVRVKRRFGPRMRSDRRNCFRGRYKLPRLNLCNGAERGLCSKDSTECPELEGEETFCRQYSLVASDIMVAEVTSGKSRPEESNQHILGENCFGTSTVCEAVSSHENLLPRALIDLNLPHAPPDFGGVEPFVAEMTVSQDHSNMNGALLTSETNQQPEHSHALETYDGMDSVDPPIANARRQSTRNRPLTTKVLEAFECGFFSARRKGRGTKAMSHGNSMPRSSRRQARDSISISLATSSGNFGTDLMDSKAEEAGEEYNSYTSMDTESQIWSERDGTDDLIGIPKTAYQPEIPTGNDDGSC